MTCQVSESDTHGSKWGLFRPWSQIHIKHQVRQSEVSHCCSYWLNQSMLIVHMLIWYGPPHCLCVGDIWIILRSVTRNGALHRPINPEHALMHPSFIWSDICFVQEKGWPRRFYYSQGGSRAIVHGSDRMQHTNLWQWWSVPIFICWKVGSAQAHEEQERIIVCVTLEQKSFTILPHKVSITRPVLSARQVCKQYSNRGHKNMLRNHRFTKPDCWRRTSSYKWRSQIRPSV